MALLKNPLVYYREAFAGLSREIWLLSLVSLINRSGAMVLPFLTVYLTHQLHFSLTDAGWIMSAFGAGSIVGSFLGGQLSDRLGYYRVVLYSLLSSGVMFLLLTQVSGFGGFAGGIFLTSLLADAFRPASMVAVTAYSRPENRARSIGLIRLAINLGFSVGPALGGFLAGHYGYQWLFVIDGLTCIGAGFFFWRALPPRPAADGIEKPVPAPGARRAVYRDGVFGFFLLIQLLTTLVFMQVFSTVPVYFKGEMGLSESGLGLLMAVNGILIVLIEMPLIMILERYLGTAALVGLGAALIGLGYLGLLLPGGAWSVGLVFIAGITVGEMINFPFSNNFAMGRGPEGGQGAYLGLYTMSFSLAHILSPLLGTYIAAHGSFDLLWLLGGALAILAGAGAMLLRRHTG
ncbi:MAG: MFS transporter [Bacteroidetes bacterium]|nr:MAG: MFS transporter [Bacteroidota bacterium]